MRTISLFVFMTGCTGGSTKDDTGSAGTPVDPSDTPTVDDTDIDPPDTGTPAACEIEVVAIYPEDGATDVYYRTPVQALLTEADETATITVAEQGSGVEIPGSTEWFSLTLVWTPDAPMATSTAYDVTLTHRCGTEAYSWTTSETGEPLTGDPIGATYEIDLSSGVWVEPAGVGALLATQLAGTSFLVSPTAIDGDSVEFIAAIGYGGLQDPCVATIAFPEAAFEDPFFSLGPADLPFETAGIVIEIESAEISGAFTPDASAIDGMALAGQIDTRALGEVLYLGTTQGAVCDLVAAFGIACEPCGDGEPYCLRTRVVGLRAPDTGTTLQEITEQDVQNNPLCN